jgi:hypothetical protein
MGLSDLLGKIKDLLSLDDKRVLIVAMAVALASWSLLLFPDRLLTTVGLVGFRSQFRSWIGLAAWLSLAWLASFALYNTGVGLHRLTLWAQASLSWRSYTSDAVDGIKWAWSWGFTIPQIADGRAVQAFAQQLIPRCPRCDANLDKVVEALRCPRDQRHYYRTFRGDHAIYLDEYRNFLNQVAGEIVRRVTTGEYRRRTWLIPRFLRSLSSIIRKRVIPRPSR